MFWFKTAFGYEISFILFAKYAKYVNHLKIIKIETKYADFYRNRMLGFIQNYLFSKCSIHENF